MSQSPRIHFSIDFQLLSRDRLEFLLPRLLEIPNNEIITCLHSSLMPFTLKVKTLDSAVYDIEATEDLAVEDLKMLVQEASGHDVDRQRLIFRGKVLKTGDSLADYSIKDGHTIHLVVRAEETQQPPVATPAAQPVHDHPPPPHPAFGGINPILIGLENGPPNIQDLGNRIGQMVHQMFHGGPPPAHAPHPQPTPARTTANGVDAMRRLHDSVFEFEHLLESQSNASLGGDNMLVHQERPTPGSVAAFGAVLSTFARSLYRLAGRIENLSPLLRSEAQLPIHHRRSAQSSSAALHTALIRLTPLLTDISNTIGSLNMGDAPGNASTGVGNHQVFVQNVNINMNPNINPNINNMMPAENESIWSFLQRHREENDESEDDDSCLDTILKSFLTCMTNTHLFALLSGNSTAFFEQEQVINQMNLAAMQCTDTCETTAEREFELSRKLTLELMSVFGDGPFGQALVNVDGFISNSEDFRNDVWRALRGVKYGFFALARLLLTPTSPTVFAQELTSWFKLFIGRLIDVLKNALIDPYELEHVMAHIFEDYTTVAVGAFGGMLSHATMPILMNLYRGYIDSEGENADDELMIEPECDVASDLPSLFDDKSDDDKSDVDKSDDSGLPSLCYSEEPLSEYETVSKESDDQPDDDTRPEWTKLLTSTELENWESMMESDSKRM